MAFGADFEPNTGNIGSIRINGHCPIPRNFTLLAHISSRKDVSLFLKRQGYTLTGVRTLVDSQDNFHCFAPLITLRHT